MNDAGHPADGWPLTTIAPTVETSRLQLRSWRKADFRPFHAIVSKPAVHHYLSTAPMAAEDCWRRLMASVGGWMLNGFGTWAVDRKSDGRLIGNIGFFTAWRALEPEFGEEPEMGWILDPEGQGQGLAAEACSAALAWLEAHHDATPVWAIVAPGNQPSLRLADTLGFEAVSETLYNDEPTVVFRRPAWR
ncbi:MAG: GNAT family N-acetyltransferase [Sphingomicrobium sp.]